MSVPRCRAPRKYTGVPCWNRVENEGDRCTLHYGSPEATLTTRMAARVTQRKIDRRKSR